MVKHLQFLTCLHTHMYIGSFACTGRKDWLIATLVTSFDPPELAAAPRPPRPPPGAVPPPLLGCDFGGIACAERLTLRPMMQYLRRTSILGAVLYTTWRQQSRSVLYYVPCYLGGGARCPTDWQLTSVCSNYKSL